MKKLLLVTVALLFVLPFAASAQEDTLTFSTYISVDVDPGDYPVYCYGPWTDYCDLDSNAAIGLSLAEVTKVYIGIPNSFRWVNVKYFEITIHGTGVDNMGVDSIKGYLTSSQRCGVEIIDVDDDTADKLVVKAYIFPQPNYEIICLVTNGAETIDRIVIRTVCTLIPTMTHYGLGILALLLIGSTVWVLRRRRRVGSVA